jgi:hypothetical protein
LRLGQTQLGEGAAVQLAYLDGIDYLSLAYVRLSAETFARLARMPALGALILRGCDVAGSVAALCGCRRLRVLQLDSTTACDDDLAALGASGMALELLNLADTAVTDRGLEGLTGLARCDVLRVAGCRRITRDGFAAFVARHPECQIVTDESAAPPVDQTGR